MGVVESVFGFLQTLAALLPFLSRNKPRFKVIRDGHRNMVIHVTCEQECSIYPKLVRLNGEVEKFREMRIRPRATEKFFPSNHVLATLRKVQFFDHKDKRIKSIRIKKGDRS